MKSKIILSIILFIFGLFGVNSQTTNCGVVDWGINNLYNTNNYRLRIVNYTNGVTLQLPWRGIVLYDGSDGGVNWDGCFTEISTNVPTLGNRLVYYSSREAIMDCKLAYARLEFYGSYWNMEIYTISKLGYQDHYYEMTLWRGTLSGADPVGTYICTGSANFDTLPLSLDVECYGYVPNECYADLKFYPSPYASTNAGIGECSVFYSAWHKDKDGQFVTIGRDAGGFAVMRIRDGDTFSLTWPTECCTLQWGIAAQGGVYIVTNGIPFLYKKVCLTMPSANGVFPCRQVLSLDDTNGGPKNLMRPPYSEASRPTAYGFPDDGGDGVFTGNSTITWKAKIKGAWLDTSHPYCDASFRVTWLGACINPAEMSPTGIGVCPQGDTSVPGGVPFITWQHILLDNQKMNQTPPDLSDYPLVLMGPGGWMGPQDSQSYMFPLEVFSDHSDD